MSKFDEKHPSVLRRQWLVRSRLFHVEELHLRFSNGAERIYERLNPDHHRAVMVVPLLDERTLLLVREYGAGLGRYYLSFPKGAMELGEEVAEAANRELMEEAGYGAHCIEPLQELALSPSDMGNRMQIVVASDLYEKQLVGDEPEPLEVVAVDIDELDELIAHPEFVEAYAVAALYMVRDRLRKSL